MRFIRDTFARTDPNSARILVTHHPLFALQVGDSMTRAVGRSELALDAIGDAGVDLLLAGHNHDASVHSARDLVTRAGAALVVQAGTATSTRVRDQSQSFNEIDVDCPLITVTVEAWDGSSFAARDAQRYERQDDHWRLAGAARKVDEAAH
jgi:predicted phosphodiesterase